MFEVDGRERLYIRLGKSKRDRRLAAYIAADIEQGANVSRLVKELLYNYYTGAAIPRHAGPVVPEEDEASRQQVLSSKLKKLSFGSLNQQ
jgi:hypothetical protein